MGKIPLSEVFKQNADGSHGKYFTHMDYSTKENSEKLERLLKKQKEIDIYVASAWRNASQLRLK